MLRNRTILPSLEGEGRRTRLSCDSDSNFKQPATRRHGFAIPRRDAPGVFVNASPSKAKGVGNAGCPLHPQMG